MSDTAEEAAARVATRNQAYVHLDAVEEALDARDTDAAQEATDRLQDRLDELEEYDDGT